jgi:GntR family transcriptional regulator
MGAPRLSRADEVEHVLLNKLQELAEPDGRLPTEAELAEMFNVSRTTVRAAVGALVARGMVVRRQGMGTFINQVARIANPLDEAIDFCELIERNACCPGIQYLDVGLSQVDEHLAGLLDCPDGKVLQRHTLFLADGAPVIYCINSIPLWVLPDGLANEVVTSPAVSEPMYDFLAQRCGQRIELSRATIWPDIARNCSIRDGLIDPSSAVLVIEETGHNSAGRPVLHSLEYYPGRFMLFELIRRRKLVP